MRCVADTPAWHTGGSRRPLTQGWLEQMSEGRCPPDAHAWHRSGSRYPLTQGWPVQMWYPCLGTAHSASPVMHALPACAGCGAHACPCPEHSTAQTSARLSAEHTYLACRAGGGAASAQAATPAPAQAAASGEQLGGVDRSKPSTSIQFRLLDGSKLTGTFNTEASVSTLRQ